MANIVSIPFLWKTFPFLRRRLSRFGINGFARRAPPRPRPFSLWSAVPKPPGEASGPVEDYTSWPSLTDKTFSSRHLPPSPADYVDQLPGDAPVDPAQGNWGEVTSLFARRAGAMKTDRSSVLFMFFAQWFTDSFLRVDPRDRRKNTSNHEIDLCQIYGLKEKTTRILRTLSGGRLKSQLRDDGEYPPYLLEREGDVLQVKCEFRELISEAVLDAITKDFPPERREKLYATGLERGNSSIGYVAISVLFLREHNRICKELTERNPDWDDERLFQTARLINIALLLRILVEDYINHINGFKLFRLDTSFAEKEEWYRPNWIAVEFDLLYRWHGLVPDELSIAESHYPASEFRTNNALLERLGMGVVISAASRNAAGRIGLGNTPSFLLVAEYLTLKMGRDFRLRSYNEYRQAFLLPKLTSFNELTKDSVVREQIARLYGHIDKVEFQVGLFAEDPEPGMLFGALMRNMVAYDAFTHIFTNPLLARRIHTAETFTAYGLDLIAKTGSLQDLVARHCDATASFSKLASMSQIFQGEAQALDVAAE